MTLFDCCIIGTKYQIVIGTRKKNGTKREVEVPKNCPKIDEARETNIQIHRKTSRNITMIRVEIGY
jgi:hypothetical protein